MPSWFKECGRKREDVSFRQRKQIKMLYRGLFLNVKNVLKTGVVFSSPVVPKSVKTVYFGMLERSIGNEVNMFVSQIKPIITSNMKEVSNAVIQDNLDFMSDVGFESEILDAAEEEKEDRINKIIAMVVSGKLYDKPWTLDGFVLSEQRKIKSDLHKIILRCLDEGMSMDEIYSNIEIYFNPDKEKRSNFVIMFPGVKRKIYYDSTRTGTTMVSHSYEETFINVTMENPFIEAYRWITSGTDKVCPVCIDRESTDKFGLGVGIFPKDKLPLDHPNGMCTFDPLYVMSDGEIIREVNLWKAGQGTRYYEINKWIKSFSKN